MVGTEYYMTNYFKELHPVSVAAYMIGMLLLILFTPYDYKMFLVLIIISFFSLYIYGIKKYLQSLAGFFVVMIGFSIFNMIFYHAGETPFLYVNDVPLTVESLEYGFYTGAMVCALFLWFKLMQELLDNRKITYLIGRKLPVIGLVISMVFTYYDKFVWKIDKIKEVWNTYEKEEKIGRLKYAGIIFSVLLSVMLEDSVKTAQSMKARGYGSNTRTNYNSYSFRLSDAAIICVTIIILVARFTVLTGFKHSFYLSILYMIIPVLFNIGRELQWKVYQSRI